MAECKYLEGLIDEMEEVGDSREKINKNFENLEAGLCTLANDVSGIGIKVDDPVTYLGTIPIGGIIVWSGSIDDIHSNWALCDGNSGTPDLRDRFIVGAGSTYSVGDTGGQTTVVLLTSELPSHSHSATDSLAGSHNHTANTVTDGVSEHSHAIVCSTEAYAENTIPELSHYAAIVTASYATSIGSEHNHTLSVSTDPAHSHVISGTSTGGSGAHNNMPPYYALAYIMRIA